MPRILLATALALLLQQVSAEQGAWQQCGGTNWRGETVCVDGYQCQHQNDYYYQCVPGSDLTSTTAKSSAALPTSTLQATTTTSDNTQPTSSATCNTGFNDISAARFIADVNPGWNLGNTLDATPDEGSWNNPPVQAATFDLIKARGFKSVRIPVTYTHHFITEAPDYRVDPAWLQRVSDVVDMATSRGLAVVTNIHHDSWEWADISTAGADIVAIQAKFYALWRQIGETLGCKPSTVAFETINEPPATTAADGARINEFNAIFLRALSDSGGFNARRVVTLAGGGMDATKTTQWFQPPANISNPWALQFHYYNPYDFTFSAWGKTIWGSKDDKAALAAELDIVRGNFSDVPLYIGEFDASPTNTEDAARWKWFDALARSARDIDAAVVLWDNGADHLDRGSGAWRDPTAIDVLMAAVEGVPNALPDSTVDINAAEQASSAYIYHRAGQDVADVPLQWLFNGNSLKSVSVGGRHLAQDTDYTVSESAITFKSRFISSKTSKTAAPGVKCTLTLSFSAGADIAVKLVQWDTPTLAQTSSSAVKGADLRIPIEWKGIDRLATVKMARSDGTPLVDDWTQYLGPLQQGRGTYDGQWSWDENNVIVRSSIVDGVADGGSQAAIFTFEFYPRVVGDNATYILNP